MWQVISDHLGTILSVLAGAATIVGAWAKMKVKLDQIEKDVLENREATKAGFSDLEIKLNGNIAQCKIDHEPCRLATIAHHENAGIHVQPDRWVDFTNRLGRIEALLMHIRDSNGR